VLLLLMLTLTAAPRDNPANWFTPADYPPAAALRGSEGRVGVTLSVSPEETPTGCTVTSPAADPALNDKTCEVLMQRARFKVSGGRSENSYTTSVGWNLTTPKVDAAAMGSIAGFRITPEGNTVACHERQIGPDGEQVGLCEALENGNIHELEKILGASLAKATQGEIRMYMQPVQAGALDIAGVPPTGAHYLKLAGADFDVLPSGAISNCAQARIEGPYEKLGLCGAVVDAGKDAFKLSKNVVHMRILVDLWVK